MAKIMESNQHILDGLYVPCSGAGWSLEQQARTLLMTSNIFWRTVGLFDIVGKDASSGRIIFVYTSDNFVPSYRVSICASFSWAAYDWTFLCSP